MRLEHVGIAVADLREANELFAKLFGKDPYKEEDVVSESVTTSFFQLGESKIELVGSNSETENAISKYISKKGQGIHHLAFEVDDIYKSMEDMKQKGFDLLSESPKQGADNKLICFLHPRSTNGVLIELCQTISNNQT
jgi:methylmalonyl-CoA/ethylmalonyl-CoA epimerase